MNPRRIEYDHHPETTIWLGREESGRMRRKMGWREVSHLSIGPSCLFLNLEVALDTG